MLSIFSSLWKGAQSSSQTESNGASHGSETLLGESDRQLHSRANEQIQGQWFSLCHISQLHTCKAHSFFFFTTGISLLVRCHSTNVRTTLLKSYGSLEIFNLIPEAN